MASRAVARETLCALRHQIAKIEGVLPERLEMRGPEADDRVVLRRRGVPERPAVRTGIGRFDAAIGGLGAGMTELHGGTVRDAGAVAGFALALASAACAGNDLPLLWIGTAEIFREAGRPYAPGLAQRFGLAPDRLLIAQAEKLADVLWIAEEAASLGSLAAILLELRGSPQKLDLTATRRLHRRALAAGRPLFLLRQSGIAQPTAAPVRLQIAPALAAPRHTLAGVLHGSIGPPAFRVSVDKNRFSAPATFTLEWNRDAGRLEERIDDPAARNTVCNPGAENPVAVASAAADGPHLPPAVREVVAFPAAKDAAPGDQPARQQRAADRSTRHLG
jgi:protein ImuA